MLVSACCKTSANTEDESEQVYIFNDPLKDLLNADDVVPEALETTSATDKKEFHSFIKQLEHIKETDGDEKVKQALDIVKFSLILPVYPNSRVCWQIHHRPARKQQKVQKGSCGCGYQSFG